MTRLWANHKLLRQLNDNALNNPKVSVINADAFVHLQKTSELYNVIIIDLPDPWNLSIGKLYTKEFYSLVKRHLSQNGIIITQASSPYYARQAYWSIYHTLGSIFPHTQAINTNVPSFGHWWMIMAQNNSFWEVSILDSLKLKYFSSEILENSTFFDNDMSKIDTEINDLQHQSTVKYYEQWLESWQ